MLILTRRIGETLMINGEEVTVTVLGVRGSQVRIGVKAPSDCVIDREEIFRRKQARKISNQQEQSPQRRTLLRNSLFKSKTH